MQTPPERFKYVVSHVSGESQMGDGLFFFYTCLLGIGGTAALVLRLFSEDVVSLRLKITMQILLSGPGSGDQGLGYQQIHHLWTYASLPAPPAKSSPSSAARPG